MKPREGSLAARMERELVQIEKLMEEGIAAGGASLPGQFEPVCLDLARGLVVFVRYPSSSLMSGFSLLS